jgi:hypothetical protein
MRYFINIVTGALAADYIAPMFYAYWKEISKEEYERKLKEDD